MQVDLSLWSADLVNLESEIRRLEPHADSFHIDVADGHFTPTLLFFPDLVARLRPLTRKPFHVHLLVTRPEQWIAPFQQAGADWFTVPIETGYTAADGLSLNLETPIESVLPHLPHLKRITLMGTPMGIKGCDLDPAACPRIQALRRIVGPTFPIYADGAIRAHTVEPLRAAGATALVAGSLVCSDLTWSSRIRG